LTNRPRTSRTNPTKTNQKAKAPITGKEGTSAPIRPSTPKTTEIQKVIFLGGVSFIVVLLFEKIGFVFDGTTLF
jgi:hypothetical protein